MSPPPRGVSQLRKSHGCRRMNFLPPRVDHWKYGAPVAPIMKHPAVNKGLGIQASQKQARGVKNDNNTQLTVRTTYIKHGDVRL
jgi:hypothetical protein